MPLTSQRGPHPFVLSVNAFGTGGHEESSLPRVEKFDSCLAAQRPPSSRPAVADGALDSLHAGQVAFMKLIVDDAFADGMLTVLGQRRDTR